MSVAISPSSLRGQVILQPSYFTSSAYIHPARDDINTLINVYTEHYAKSHPSRPFNLFKEIWQSQGWTWLHFKVFDARSRETFLKITMRLFSERLVPTEAPLNRAVALFGLYTFFYTQPSTSAPPLHSIAHFPISMDLYTSVLSLPDILSADFLLPLRSHVIYVLSALVKSRIFQILPTTDSNALNPRELPREIYVQDNFDTTHNVEQHTGQSSANLPKKKGRPTKREKIRKAKDALAALDKWIDRTTYTYQPPQAADATEAIQPVTTHILLSHPPSTTRNNYRTRKSDLLDAIDPLHPPGGNPGQAALGRANAAVLARLKRIDEEAAAKGLEVGGEGGERTGLERVERAVGELGKTWALGRRGGILGLLEGAGIDEPARHQAITAPVDGRSSSGS
ncbi:hypothetical protein BV22DRAFT_1192087 [Leucogyrophana mollusca]|uniref:Uncharacterized protein n=1 Tax=Leucogyrophana mollusca TaxID=85980 RepID=A0ACB8BV62_9AGAM|nr:hypothetical protein BV22DRAFT_1192087 [Leucogyrophana mollusca]